MKASSMSMQSNNIDPQKAKKRYLILTYLEKFNVNDQNETHNSSAIKEEIEAENDKTHYPLPLSMIEIDNINSIKQ